MKPNVRQSIFITGGGIDKVNPFLEDTEPAVQHLFQGLKAYYLTSLLSILQYRDKTGDIRMTKEENEKFFKGYNNSLALVTARASLAGSILQITYSGLK
jgi:hypothetical protein